MRFMEEMQRRLHKQRSSDRDMVEAGSVSDMKEEVVPAEVKGTEPRKELTPGMIEKLGAAAEKIGGTQFGDISNQRLDVRPADDIMMARRQALLNMLKR